MKLAPTIMYYNKVIVIIIALLLSQNYLILHIYRNHEIDIVSFCHHISYRIDSI